MSQNEFAKVEALRPKARAAAPEKIASNVMKAVQFYSPYGYRAKIGIITPGVNTALEPELYHMAPKGVSFHANKLMLTGKATPESYNQMIADTENAARELETAEVDVIAWACTSGSVLTPPSMIEEKIVAAAHCPAFCTITAVIAALRAMGKRRIALGTPYVSFINETEIEFLENAGFEVVSMYGLELGVTQEERRGIGRVPPSSLHRFCRHIDREEADVLFISCANMAGVHELAAIEADRGKPVITSNLVTFWHALRLAGVNDRIEGFGHLLANY